MITENMEEMNNRNNNTTLSFSLKQKLRADCWVPSKTEIVWLHKFSLSCQHILRGFLNYNNSFCFIFIYIWHEFLWILIPSGKEKGDHFTCFCFQSFLTCKGIEGWRSSSIEMEEKSKFLHGTLEVTIFRATTYKPSVPFKVSFFTWELYLLCPLRVNFIFQILCAHPPDTTITITLKRKRTVLGKIDIQADKLLGESSLINGFFPLSKQNGKPNKKLKLQFIVWFKPSSYVSTSNWSLWNT